MVSHSAQRFQEEQTGPFSKERHAATPAPKALNSFNSVLCPRRSLLRSPTNELIIRTSLGADQGNLDVRRHILVKEAQRAKCQRQQRRAFNEFENCDREQSSAAVYFTAFRSSSSSRHIKPQTSDIKNTSRHYFSYRGFTLGRTENDCVSLRRNVLLGTLNIEHQWFPR